MGFKKKAALAYLFIAAYILLVSPWTLHDPDELSHLAAGRYIFQHHSVPTYDPFTFTNPNMRWCNPEWLGDVLFFSTYHYFGNTGLHLFKLLIISLGWMLALKLTLRYDTSLLFTLCLSSVLIFYSISHFTLRNRIHALWLVPLYMLIIEKHKNKPWVAYYLLPLGALWANLHSSFVLGWLIIGAYAVHELLDKPQGKGWRILLVIGLLHPLLALVSPYGIHNYDQLIDHFLNIEIYKNFILEWNHINQTQDPLKYMPFHLLGVAGLLSFLPKSNRKRVNLLFLFAAILLMCYSSNRFIALLALLGAITLAINLPPLLYKQSKRAKIAIALVLSTFLAAFFGSTVLSKKANANDLDILRTQANKYSRASDFLNNNAPKGSRVFNPYNHGPFMLWYMADKCPYKIYIDPRNNLGGKAIEYYKNTLLKDTVSLQNEINRHKINLVLVSLKDNLMERIHFDLDNNPQWPLVFFDGVYAVYAKDNQQNQDLIRKNRYQIIRAHTGFEYLLPFLSGEHANHPLFQRELMQVQHQAPHLTQVLEAYKLLIHGGYPPPLIHLPNTPDTSKAIALLQEGCPHLGPSPERTIYFACAYARQKDRDTCNQFLDYADMQFPGHYMVLGLKLELAKTDRNLDQFRLNLNTLQNTVPQTHFIWQILQKSPN